MQVWTVPVLLAALFLNTEGPERLAGAGLPLGIRLYGVPTESRSMLSEALAVAESILRQAGVRPVWTDCTEPAPALPCGGLVDEGEVVARLFPGLGATPDTCAASLRPADHRRGQLVTLFIECINQGAVRVRTRAPVVFAYVLLHEIGHLLLPEGHARVGIMQPRLSLDDWHLAARGALRFLPDEGVYIRAVLATEGLRASRP